MAGFKQFLILLLISVLLISCATIRQLTSLSDVSFRFDRVTSASLAGIDLMRINNPEQLDLFDLARFSKGIAGNSLPLDLGIQLKMENPQANRAALTLTKMDWVLLIREQETIRGSLQRPVELAAGATTIVPLQLRINLAKFFADRADTDMIDLALAVAGAGGKVPQDVALKISPTIETPYGPLSYRNLVLRPASGKE